MASARGPRVLMVWTVPRSCSTVLERSLMNRADVGAENIIHEPHSHVFYHGSPAERGSARFETLPPKGVTHEDVLRRIDDARATARRTKDGGSPLIVVKDMCYHLARADGSMDPELVERALRQADFNVFLVRTPKKQVPSLYRMTVNTEMRAPGFEYFDPREVGYDELKYMYECAQRVGCEEGSPSVPVVVDADELVGNPKEVLGSLCEVLGIAWDERMLSWEDNGKFAELCADWSAWHQDAINSVGFVAKPTTRCADAGEESQAECVRQAIARAMPVYNDMLKACIKT